MARKEFSRKNRTAAIERAAGHCEKCKAALKKGEGEVDHILPDVLGGEPVLANAQVLCQQCHAEKTADDIRRTRKADRQRDKNNGAIKPSSKLAKPSKSRSASPSPSLPVSATYSVALLAKVREHEREKLEMVFRRQ